MRNDEALKSGEDRVGGFFMTSLQAKSKMKKYLKEHFIKHQEDTDDGVSRYTMLYEGCDCCPDKVLEACIWFYQDLMECRVYYNRNGQQWCRESKNRDDLLKLLNFINARLWVSMDDGEGGALYSPNYLYTSRFYVTEDFDIVMTTMIPYDFYEVAPLETEDYVTGACPDVLEMLSAHIFCVLLGEMSAEQAIMRVKTEILGESENA